MVCHPALLSVLIALALATPANAEVTRFKVLERTASALQGRGFGAAGQVEKITASATIALDPANLKSTLWNPAGASFEAACRHAGVDSGTVAVIGGPGVFGMFMDRYDAFWLSAAPHVRLPGGEPCFPGVPACTPQEILAAHGLRAGDVQTLDAVHDVTVTPWRR